MTKQHKTILVVDDDQTLRDGLRAVLQEQGFSTLEADDGLEAREIIETCRPNLVILDMMMPRWGGLAVLEHFKGKTNAPRFMMMTATDGAKHKAYAEKIGVADYIHKPFTMKRLLEGVDKILNRVPAATPEEPKSQPTVRCRCRGCGARIKAGRQLLGLIRSCPGCHRDLLVQEELDDQGPMLLAANLA